MNPRSEEYSVLNGDLPSPGRVFEKDPEVYAAAKACYDDALNAADRLAQSRP